MQDARTWQLKGAASEVARVSGSELQKLALAAWRPSHGTGTSEFLRPFGVVLCELGSHGVMELRRCQEVREWVRDDRRDVECCCSGSFTA